MMLRWMAPLTLALATPAAARLDPPAWTQPIAPFHVVGPIWYVGTQGLAAYLIRTCDGAILLDATMAENVPAIKRNIAALGVPITDVKLLLNSHAHFDHAAGLARLKADSGARLAAGVEDRDALDSGLPPGETSYGVIRFPPVHVDRAVRDGERVRLGDVVVTRIATPGHTPGNSTWTMRVRDPAVAGGRALDVVFLGSLTVAGNKLVGNARYPGIVAGFEHSFARLATVHADVVLTPHPEVAEVLERHAHGGGAAYLDPTELPRLVELAQLAFRVELAKAQGRWGADARPTAAPRAGPTRE